MSYIAAAIVSKTLASEFGKCSWWRGSTVEYDNQDFYVIVRFETENMDVTVGDLVPLERDGVSIRTEQRTIAHPDSSAIPIVVSS